MSHPMIAINSTNPTTIAGRIHQPAGHLRIGGIGSGDDDVSNETGMPSCGANRMVT